MDLAYQHHKSPYRDKPALPSLVVHMPAHHGTVWLRIFRSHYQLYDVTTDMIPGRILVDTNKNNYNA